MKIFVLAAVCIALVVGLAPGIVLAGDSQTPPAQPRVLFLEKLGHMNCLSEEGSQEHPLMNWLEQCPLQQQWLFHPYPCLQAAI